MARIHEALIACMRDIGAVGKNKKNTGQNYMFRGIDDVYAAAHPVFAEHGVLCLPEVLTVQREERASSRGGTLIYTAMRVQHTFVAEDGSSVSCITAGEGMDSGDKSSNKAMSAALKYAILETLMVPVDEPIDSEYDNPQPAPKANKQQKQHEQTVSIDDQVREINNGTHGDALRKFMVAKGAILDGQSLVDMNETSKKKLIDNVDSLIAKAYGKE